LRKVIEETENPMALWIELRFQLGNHYSEEPRDDVISRFYQYAKWCFFDSKSSDVVNAVACAFYEHIPEDKILRDDLHRWLSVSDFTALKDVFQYLKHPSQFHEFKKEFLAKRQIALLSNRKQKRKT
jgi:hypothetical protein